ncbi:MAG: hypothetical protein HN894_13600 [Bacteroidetes bacterium]|nr:hypothetical protein [Bacteroidota bacterium]
MRKYQYLLLLFSLFLCSCNTINDLGLKYFPDDYVFEKADGSTYRTWNIAKDRQNYKNRTSLKLGDFNKNDINKYYENIDSSTIQELTVKDLQTQFNEFDYTLISIWYGCPGTYFYELWQYRDLVDTLSKIAENPNKIAFVLASLTYDYRIIDRVLKGYKYHYQSYIIPSKPYSEKCLLKTIFFAKELCPECYAKLKDDISENTIFLLDRNGKVVKMIDYQYDEETWKKEIKDYDKVRDELISLMKK